MHIDPSQSAADMMMTSVAFTPAPVARTAVRPARCARVACHAALPQRPVDMQPLKAGAAGLAAALLLVGGLDAPYLFEF